jgi:hypothetical protein
MKLNEKKQRQTHFYSEKIFGIEKLPCETHRRSRIHRQSALAANRAFGNGNSLIDD